MHNMKNVYNAFRDVQRRLRPLVQMQLPGRGAGVGAGLATQKRRNIALLPLTSLHKSSQITPPPIVFLVYIRRGGTQEVQDSGRVISTCLPQYNPQVYRAPLVSAGDWSAGKRFDRGAGGGQYPAVRRRLHPHEGVLCIQHLGGCGGGGHPPAHGLDGRIRFSHVPPPKLR